MHEFPVTVRLRGRSSRVLAATTAAEIVAAAVIVAMWPRAWPVASVLLALAGLRLSVLSERAGEGAPPRWGRLFSATRWTAVALAAVAVIALIAGALRLAVAGSTGY